MTVRLRTSHATQTRQLMSMKPVCENLGMAIALTRFAKGQQPKSMQRVLSAVASLHIR
jgi:hypothetical protein